MNRLTTVVLALTASLAFAQTPGSEVFLHRAGTDPDHRWTEYYSSDRFIVWYSSNPADEANITEAAAKTALAELEMLFDKYIYELEFQHPYASYTDDRKFKIGAYVLRNGANHSEGWAFGGTSGNPAGPGMWLDARAVTDKWALAHEFMHGLQQMAGGFMHSDFVGWFHESHANLMPHYVYTDEIHYCSEMYTRMPEIYLGSTRNRYCNWHFFWYLIDKYGMSFVNDLWSKAHKSGSNQSSADPFSEAMRIHGISQKEFGDLVGDFAAKMVIWDFARSPRFRAAYNANSVAERNKRPRYTYLEALDETDGANGRFVSPFAISPQRYAFNLVRLYPDETRTIKVRFRGDVQTKNNIANYTKNLPLEPDAAYLPDDPGSDWRYTLIAVTGSAASTSAATSARYSETMRASDGNPDLSMQLRDGEAEVYLAVAATPSVHHKIKWDQFYYTVYRFPYMVEITGAKPEGFQEPANPAGGRHANGGGFVASTATVAATAYVGEHARVLDRAQVSGTARIEGRAVVKGSAQVKDSAIVKDYALIAGGEIFGKAVVAEGAKVWGGSIGENARIEGAANVHVGGSGGKVYGNARIGGSVWMEPNTALNLSGTAQLLGDGEVYGVTANKGVFFGIVDNATVTNNQQGANRTEPPVEVTKLRSMKWYGEEGGTGINFAGKGQKGINASTKRFAFDSRGVLRYNLGGAARGRLLIVDGRGRVVRNIGLDGSRAAVDTDIKRHAASQVLFWRVDVGGRVVGKGRVNNM